MNNRNKRFFIIMIGLVLLAFLAGGCTTLPESRERARIREEAEEEVLPNLPVPLKMASDLKFDDIPVPYGFKIDQYESFAFQTGSTRLGVLRYKGSVAPDRIVAFYKEQMPVYNWDLINIIEYGRRMLTFERAQEICIITIEPTRGRASLVIAVSPRSEAK